MAFECHLFVRYFISTCQNLLDMIHESFRHSFDFASKGCGSLPYTKLINRLISFLIKEEIFSTRCMRSFERKLRQL